LANFTVVAPSDLLRARVEHEIRTTYWERFGARLTTFPRTLVASISPSGAVECAAGVRFSGERFFSECYLDLPVEAVLQYRSGRRVQRSRIIEICHLVGSRPGRSRSFIGQFINYAELGDAEWLLFTATRSLRALLERSGVKMTQLGRADRGRVPTPSDWGCYYEHDPLVMAVHRDASFRFKRRSRVGAPLGACANA
jgi:hypothetical protein